MRDSYGNDTANSQNTLFKLISKEVIPESLKEDILSTEKRGMEAQKSYVQERIIGKKNMWDRMTKTKIGTWNSVAKDLRVTVGSEVLTLKATAG